MLKPFRLYPELSYEAKKVAMEEMKTMMVDMVKKVISGSIPPSVLIDYLTDPKRMDEMALRFVFDEQGEALKPRSQLSISEVDSGLVSIYEEEPTIIN